MHAFLPEENFAAFLGEDKEAGVAAEIRQTGLRLRNNGLGGNMATAGRMKRAWGDMRR